MDLVRMAQRQPIERKLEHDMREAERKRRHQTTRVDGMDDDVRSDRGDLNGKGNYARIIVPAIDSPRTKLYARIIN